MTKARLRAELLRALSGALDELDPAGRVRAALARVRWARRRVRVVAIGKAAAAMTEGALDALPSLERALVVLPDDTPLPWRDPRVEVLRAAHPDPDRRSVAAGSRALAFAREADLLIVLLSGGASSLVVRPWGMTLTTYRRVTRAVRLAGATIQELNLVRRHLCALKGGGLALAAPADVLTLVVSDVLGGGVHDVGSGPSVPDPTTAREASAVLRRLAPEGATLRLRSTVSPGNPRARLWRARVLAGPEDLARTIARRLRDSLERVAVGPPSNAPVETLVAEYRRLLSRLPPGGAFVRVAEPSLILPHRHGQGGRSTHLAAALAPWLPEDVLFLAAASDGVDGESGTAGAIVDASLPPVAIAKALAGFDTGALLRRHRMALPGAPTGHNLADVHVLARA